MEMETRTVYEVWISAVFSLTIKYSAVVGS